MGVNKTWRRNEAPEAAQLRAQIIDIIVNEYIGDIPSELWTRLDVVINRSKPFMPRG
jgi:hypothetical protein